ncbi:MAG: hypothetical protein R3E10_03390 [Gemmatimonadota bacterium]
MLASPFTSCFAHLAAEGQHALRTNDRRSLRMVLADLAEYWERSGDPELAREVRLYAHDVVAPDDH